MNRRCSTKNLCEKIVVDQGNLWNNFSSILANTWHLTQQNFSITTFSGPKFFMLDFFLSKYPTQFFYLNFFTIVFSSTLSSPFLPCKFYAGFPSVMLSIWSGSMIINLLQFWQLMNENWLLFFSRFTIMYFWNNQPKKFSFSHTNWTKIIRF